MRQEDEKLTATGEAPRPREPLVLAIDGHRLEVRLVTVKGQRALLLEERRAAPDPAGLASLGLSPRETEVLAALARGEANEAIAARVGSRPRTVAKHVERVYRKLGVESRAAAAARAFDAWSAAEAQAE